MPFYGLRWALIILNEFLPQVVTKRKEAKRENNYNIISILKQQLQRSEEYCLSVQKMI